MQEREKEMSAVNGLMGLHSHLTKKKKGKKGETQLSVKRSPS